MRGLSRASLAEVEERFNAVAGSADLGTLADELFSVADLFDREHGLRRNLSDPARPAAQKAQVVRVLLEGKISDAALETVVAAVSARWARSGDLADALERLGVIAASAEAEAQSRLDDVEDELFRFGRIVASNLQLHRTLTSSAAPEQAKRELLGSLLAAKVAPTTLRLITQLVVHPRGRSLDSGLEEFGRLVAAQRQRLVAVVRSAIVLSEEQKQRLATWLRTSYGRDVHLNVEVDPRVLGGFSVHIGDDLIDTTIAGRIEEVRRRLAG
ncbi:F0F1 ATP synthase subunit delta [Streptosporangium sp. NBC_01755]|uniref:F0F1 ATP synthase subunit delta n=1 Tax=unclassified Streptosporangium TaxID=2632669 RepID=UPI002DD9F24B|nr:MULTISPECIES: F0F1 ATP synthase subunit delta [unclassified Streptosporangium]WSA23911.1 F0F1 ATP synthase subunit delta [Streptosporangium sp. NBC_01810]WSC98014.1 F0F1 ATP synthase subunit delta [Streptosporangium sp. NBC_01755]